MGWAKAVQVNYCPGFILKTKTGGSRAQFNHVARFKRHVCAVEQYVRVNRRAFRSGVTLTRDDDLPWRARIEVIRRRDGLRERQPGDPRHLRILHRPDNFHGWKLLLL